MTDLQKKAKEIYRRMTSYADYSEMNGISKKWILGQIEAGLEEYHKSELLKLNKSDVISSVSESGIRLDLDKILNAKDTFKKIL